MIDLSNEREVMIMTKYTAIFENGTIVERTSELFSSRLEFYNWICRMQYGKLFGGLIEILATWYPN